MVRILLGFTSRGMFFEFENEFLVKDSSFRLVLGARYVDPNFRSAGSQTRRIDFNNEIQKYGLSFSYQ